jgi:hypothetical protein
LSIIGKRGRRQEITEAAVDNIASTVHSCTPLYTTVKAARQERERRGEGRDLLEEALVLDAYEMEQAILYGDCG